MKQGRPQTRTPDYTRNGTTALFAALNTLDGTVIGLTMAGHRQQEFLGFPDIVDGQLASGRQVHVILDNDGMHKTERVRQWLSAHTNWTFPFTPTSSWLNAVEGFYAKLTRRRLKGASFSSVGACEAAIERFIAEHNDREAKPFKWTADPSRIIAARKRGFQVINSYHKNNSV